MNTTSTNNNPAFIGQKYGYFTVIGFEHRGKVWRWKCQCECGNVRSIIPAKLRTGHTKSCGCKKVDRCHELTKKYRITHGGRYERLYRIWQGMKERCECQTARDYKGWGARGIKMCEEWANDYAVFRAWALSHGYKSNLSIDRIDNDGDYCPENCRWATQKEQGRNKRDTIFVELNGIRKPLITWCEEKGMNYGTVYGRIRYKGWNVETALNTPPKKTRRHAV